MFRVSVTSFGEIRFVSSELSKIIFEKYHFLGDGGVPAWISIVADLREGTVRFRLHGSLSFGKQDILLTWL